MFPSGGSVLYLFDCLLCVVRVFRVACIVCAAFVGGRICVFRFGVIELAEYVAGRFVFYGEVHRKMLRILAGK